MDLRFRGNDAASRVGGNRSLLHFIQQSFIPYPRRQIAIRLFRLAALDFFDDALSHSNIFHGVIGRNLKQG